MTTTQPTEPLRLRYEALKSEQPKLRIRNAAQILGVSEAELLATGAFHEIIHLKPAFKSILADLPKLDEVMALTRNNEAVHEVHGQYDNVSFEGPIGLVVTPTIDLRLFLFGWKYAFAVATPFKNDFRRSIQFFNAQGEAVHKVFLTDKSNHEAYDQIVAHYRLATPVDIQTAPYTPTEEAPDADIDVEGFQKTWRALKDTHDFFGMTRDFGVSRTQALRVGPPEMVDQVDPQSAVKLLTRMSEDGIPIMIFVGNRHCIQIFTGPLERLVRTGDWFNVLDPGFNLHLKDGEIAAAYIVRKPTVDGIVTALELYNDAGENIALLFGERKPGIPEDPRWRERVEALIQ